MKGYRAYNSNLASVVPVQEKEQEVYCFCCTEGCNEQHRGRKVTEGTFYIEHKTKFNRNVIVPVTSDFEGWNFSEGQAPLFYTNNKDFLAGRNGKKKLTKEDKKRYTKILIGIIVGTLSLVLILIFALITYILLS